VLSFIRPDQWIKKPYERPLRDMVTAGYHLRAFVDMVDTPAFVGDVVAYPGIFVIADEPPRAASVARRPAIAAAPLCALATALTGTAPDAAVERVVIATGREPWIVDARDGLALVRHLEADLPTIEKADCKVRLGVASGSDKAFIAPMDELDV